MIRHKIVWCDRGFYSVYIGFCPSARAWDQELRKLKMKDPPPYPAKTSGARCSHFDAVSGRVMSLVTVADSADKCEKGEIIALIVHEAVHVWQRICDEIGERSPGQECEAYAVQSISQDLLYAYSRTRRKIL